MFEAEVFAYGELGLTADELYALTPREYAIKVSWYNKKHDRFLRHEAWKICNLVNVHISKKSKQIQVKDLIVTGKVDAELTKSRNDPARKSVVVEDLVSANFKD